MRRPTIQDQATLAHSLVAAHGDRVQEIARLYGLLERAVAAGGTTGDAARDAHRALCARIVEWEAADLTAERRDVVLLPAEQQKALQDATAGAIAHAERHADGLPPAAHEHAVVRSLRRIHAAFPTALPSAALVRLRRSAARLKRIQALNGPAFLLGGEAEVLLGALESATAPIAPRELEFDPDGGFHADFVRGLDACVIREPGAAGGVDLGLGTSPAVAALLGVAGEDLRELYERWSRSAAPSHPFARHPYVQRGRFCTPGPARLVRADLDSTGPVGWAAGDDVATVARDLLAVAGEQPALAPQLRSASIRVESAARCGHAVIGLIEYLPPEAEGQRRWLTDPEGDVGR